MAADGSVVIEILADAKKFVGTLGELTGKAVKGLTAAVATATAAVGALGAAAVKVGSEFETAFAGTSTMFGDVAVDTEGLTAQLLSLSNASGIAASDLTNSLYNALSAGIPVTEDMNGAMEFMESATKLAAAGFTDVDTAVTATAKVMNAYGMGLDDVNRIQTIMLQTQNKGITTVNELGSTLAQVTPTAAAMGVSFENVGAALATMTAQGTPTAQATTQLNSLIAELGKNGTVAAENLNKATAGTKYAGKSFTELANAGVPLNEILDLMADYAEANGLSLLDMFSSIEAGKAALAMAGENSGTFAENLAAMGTEADVIGEAYGKVTDTLEHKLKALKEGVNNLGIAVYNDLKEPLKDMADMAGDWLSKITDAFNEGGLTAAVGALGGVLSDMVAYAAGMAPKMIDAGVGLLMSLLAGIQQNLPALAEGAVGIVTSLVSGIAGMLPQLAETAVQLILSLAGGLSEALPELVPVAVQAIITLVQGLVGNLPALIQAAGDLIRGLVKGLVASIPLLLDAAPSIIGGLVSAFDSLMDEIVGVGADIVSGVWDGICSMAGWIKDKVKGFFSGIVDGVKDFLGIHSPSRVFAEIGNNTVAGYADGVDSAAGSNEKRVLNTVSKLSDSMAGAFGSGGGDAGAALMNNLTASARASLMGVAAVGGTSVSSFCDGVTAGLGQVELAAEGIINLFCTTALNRRDDMYEVGSLAMEGFNEGLRIKGKQAIATARSIANAVIAEMQRAMDIHSPSRKMRDLVGIPTAQGFIAGFENEMDGWGKRMQDAVNMETAKISVNTAAGVEERAAERGVTREVHTSQRTVEKVARIEGDGMTDELVRMLRLRLKEEDDRVGETLED